MLATARPSSLGKAGAELWEEACYEGNALSMEHFLARFEIYPGITGEQARELRRAWEAREGAR